MPVKKKVLFVAHNSFLYGANKSMLSVAKYLKEDEGYVPFVLCPSEGGLTDELRKSGIEYITHTYHNTCINTGLKGLLGSLLHIVMDMLRFPLLARKVKKLDPDIIHSNSSVTYHGHYMAKLLNKVGLQRASPAFPSIL
jgi:hypothetical protein